jgi:AcrR family transcriptional regulator
MEQIAAAAGVGKATLYRRYPDVASVAVALLDEHERGLQGEVLSPGRPATMS